MLRMTTAAKLFGGTILFAIAVSVAGTYVAVRLSATGIPRSMQIALVLGILANLLLAFMAWRAWQGYRPAMGGPAGIVFKVMTSGALLLAFGPRILAAITR